MISKRLIDGDGHIFEDPEAISKHMPSIYQQRHPTEGGIPLNRLFPPLDHFHHHVGETPPGSFQMVDHEGWLTFMHDIGLESTVLYPTGGLASGRIVNRDWAIAVCRAYNDWLTDAYLSRSGRFKGMALIPLQEPEAAVEELRRAVLELGMVGAMLPANGLKSHLGSKEFWPIYAEAERLGCCLALHGGSYADLGMNDMNVYTPVHAYGMPFALMIGFGGIIFNGIFDKYPGSRIGFLEGGVSWLLVALERYERDHETHMQWDLRQELGGPQRGQSAKQYVVDQIKAGRVVIGCEGHEPDLEYIVKTVGANPCMFSSDFPHEVNLEFCMRELDEIRESEGLSEADKEGILFANAERFYRLTSIDVTAGQREFARAG